jgi:hypothetical protein
MYGELSLLFWLFFALRRNFMQARTLIHGDPSQVRVVLKAWTISASLILFKSISMLKFLWSVELNHWL